MEHLYAEALVKLVEKGMKPREAAGALAKLLERRGRTRSMPRIVRALRSLSEAARAREKTVLCVARRSDERSARAESGVSKDAHVVVDETQIGGWSVRGGGRLIDASYKQALVALYTRIRT